MKSSSIRFMRSKLVLLALSALAIAQATAQKEEGKQEGAQKFKILRQSEGKTKIFIDEFQSGRRIGGHLTGIASDAETRKKYKVMVYVFTTMWYVHPFAEQGEGRTWTALRSDEERVLWSILTEKRRDQAAEVAALLVPATTLEGKSSSELRDVSKFYTFEEIVKKTKPVGWVIIEAPDGI